MNTEKNSAGPLCDPAHLHIPRSLSFEGRTNFRDLGGYPAAEGKRIKYGLLYRGSTLYNLQSIADREVLQQLNLRMIIDLRSREEAEKKPAHVAVRAISRIVQMLYPQ